MQAYRVTIIVAIVAVTCNQLVFTFLLLFACNPVCLPLHHSMVYTDKVYVGCSSMGYQSPWIMHRYSSVLLWYSYPIYLVYAHYTNNEPALAGNHHHHCLHPLHTPEKKLKKETGTSLGFDIIIIALPLPVLLTLQLRLRQKVPYPTLPHPYTTLSSPPTNPF